MKAEELLSHLNKHLEFNTYCQGFYTTISDLFAYAYVAVSLISLSDEDKLELLKSLENL